MYINQLTFLRFLAALLVIIFHFGKDTWPFNSATISFIVNEGSIAVSFFFFLSGLVLALNYLGKQNFSTRDFFIKRFARIYPIYIVAFLFALILGMVINDAYPKGGSILLQTFSLHAWFPGKCLEINFPTWSISVEVFFYLLFPALLILLRRLGKKGAVLFILLFWAMSAGLHYLLSNYLYISDNDKIAQFILYFPLWHLNTFIMGILCAKFIIYKKEKEHTNFLLPRLLFLFGTISFFLILGTDNFIKPYTHNGLMSPVFFAIAAGLAIDKSLLTNFLSNNLFVILGNASYAMYIFQWPVFLSYTALIGIEKLSGYQFYVYVILLILLSILINLTIEKKLKQVIINKWIKTKN